MTARATFEDFKAELEADLKDHQTIYIMNYRVDCGRTQITLERSGLNVTNHVATDDAWDVYQYLGDKIATELRYDNALVLARKSAAEIEYQRILGELPSRVGS